MISAKLNSIIATKIEQMKQINWIYSTFFSRDTRHDLTKSVNKALCDHREGKQVREGREGEDAETEGREKAKRAYCS